MLIEAAFFKLPEVLTSRYDHADTYEGTLLSSFVACVMMELNSRNIPNPHEHVCTEKPYPTIGSGQRRWRADLLLKLSGAVDVGGRRQLYGMRELSWLELKGFFESTRSSSIPPKTVQAGLVFRDLLRVCLLPEELPGSIRQNARYVLVVLANEPRASLPFGARQWLEDLFREGHSEPHIVLSNEPESFRRSVGQGFVAQPDLDVRLVTQTYVFEPTSLIPSPVFWGYLIRITGFNVATPHGVVTFEDVPGDPWPPERIAGLEVVRKYVIDQIRSSGSEQ